jgi:hypothetical protein
MKFSMTDVWEDITMELLTESKVDVSSDAATQGTRLNNFMILI